MVAAADFDRARSGLNLEVALQAKRWVARLEHLCVHRAVWHVANRATFAGGFVFEHEWSLLRGMTLGAAVENRR